MWASYTEGNEEYVVCCGACMTHSARSKYKYEEAADIATVRIGVAMSGDILVRHATRRACDSRAY
jgi:hypothetical protein